MALLLLPVFALSAFKFGDCRSAAQVPTKASPPEPVDRIGKKFLASLPQGFHLPAREDRVGWRLLADYGAVFAARGGAAPPPGVMFPDEASVACWQAALVSRQVRIGGIPIELQAPAMEALEAAQQEAIRQGLKITPRGRDAARRDYRQTLQLWRSRVIPGLEYWVRQGQLTRKEASRLRDLPLREQVAEILRLENQGLFFSKDLSKSILYSVAAPGSSQHLSLLAFDVAEHGNPTVRAILSKHGWFQTVVSDLPHFTYLGVQEQELPSLGLRKVAKADRTFWVPEIPAPGMGAPE